MVKRFVTRRVVSAGFLISLLILAFGALQVFDAIQKYDKVAAIPVQPLVDSAKDNPTNATTLVLLDKQKKDALIQRSEALSIVGVGVVLFGIASFLYTFLPEQSKLQTPS